MLTAGEAKPPMNLAPEDVINALCRADGYIPLIFLNGGCWKFHEFLKLLFPSAKPFKVAVSAPNEFDHIITEIGGVFYDITGAVQTEGFRSCVPVEGGEVQKFQKWSFSKNNLLFKRCPHCGEEIMFHTTGEIEQER